MDAPGAGRSRRLPRLMSGAGAQRLLVGDRGEHAQRGVAPVVVVVLDPGGDRLPGLGAGGEVLQAAQFELQRGVPALDGRVVQGRADPAHRLRDADPLTRRAKRARGVLTALVAVEDHAGDRLPATAHRDRHGQRVVGQLGVVVLAEGEPDDPPRTHVQHAVQIQLALVGDDLGAVAVPLAIQLVGREVPADQVRRPPPPPALAGGLLAPLLSPGDEVLVAHDLRDGVLADPLPGLLQVGGDPRGAVSTVMLGEQPGDLGGQRDPAGVLRRGVAVPPLVEPRLADAQRPTGGCVRHLMLLPLGGDKGGHRYRPIASSTQRATERLSTSRCIRSSVTSLRSRTSSARSSSLNAALPFSRLRRLPAHQLPSAPSLIPNSRATCAIGLLPRIAEVVHTRFGLDYTLPGLDLLLHRLGWSVQVPARAAAERDEEQIAAWREEAWPTIKRPRRTWAPGSLRRRIKPGAPGRPRGAPGDGAGAPRWCG